MPIEIKIYTTLEDRSERDQIDAAMEALGFTRTTMLLGGGLHTQMRVMPANEPKTGPQTEPAPQPPQDNDHIEEGSERFPEPATTRQRGQPSPGKARRTKAEIAEDEASDEADKQFHNADVASQEAHGLGSLISTGEERTDPDDEQDAADEAAEASANKTDDALTHEDLRKALADYSKKHGMKAAVAAVKPGGIIGCTVDQVPVERIADVISTLHDVRKAEVVTDEETAAPAYPATKDGLMKAMLDYALKYDGTNDIAKASMEGMPATMTDCPAIFEMRFGAGIKSLSKVPADGYAQAIADVQEATVKNPFNREVK